MAVQTLTPAPPQAPPRLYTVEELLEISTRDKNRYELIRGELVQMPPAGFEHGSTAIKLGARIQIYVEDNNLGVAFAAETGFSLGRNPDTVRAPDAGFVSNKNLPAGSLPRSYFKGAPDLAVEVVLPGDRASEVQDKIQEWLLHGTKLVWVVDPKTRTLTVYRADGTAQVLKPGDVLDGEDVTPGFQLAIAKVFT